MRIGTTAPRWLPSLLLAGALCLVAFTTRGDAPLGRYVSSVETVRDAYTQLTWQRTVPTGTYTQAQGASYCATLNLSGLGWRLPSVTELLSLIDFTRANPAIDIRAFANTPSEMFWTSTPYVATAGSFWFVDFALGGSVYRPSSEARRVRCVR